MTDNLRVGDTQHTRRHRREQDVGVADTTCGDLDEDLIVCRGADGDGFQSQGGPLFRLAGNNGSGVHYVLYGVEETGNPMRERLGWTLRSGLLTNKKKVIICRLFW